MLDLSTDGIVTILIAMVIGGLAIGWLFAGQRRSEPTTSLEQMRLGGREADSHPALAAAPNAAPLATAPALEEPAHAPEEVTDIPATHQPSAPPLQSPTSQTAPVVPPEVEETAKPRSAEHASAMSIAAALVRHDKPGPAAATHQRPPGLKIPRGGVPDDLTQIKGVGSRLEGLLNGLGYHHFDQIASWSKAEVAWIDQNLVGCSGRASRDMWVSQAQALATDRARTAAPRLKSLH